MTAAPCPNCGGVLPEVLYRRTVTCAYCSATAPNPGCVRVGDEVLVTGTLATVTQCDGPDAIIAHGATYRFEDVIPVVRATEALESGTGVYVREGGWRFTYTSSRVVDGKLKVKHDNAQFQDSFFDRDAMIEDIRLDARPADLGGHHGKRGMFGSFLAQLRDSPGEALFNVGFKAIFAIIFVIVTWRVLRAFVFSH